MIRDQAIQQNLKVYFDGVPCKNGHIDHKRTDTQGCVTCHNISYQKYYQRNKGKIISAVEKRRKENPLLPRFYTNKRRKKIRKATPLWADLKEIKRIYLNCPKEMVVDHIIPLQGKLVCGLHVENNLQYLSDSENASKNNKFIP